MIGSECGEILGGSDQGRDDALAVAPPRPLDEGGAFLFRREPFQLVEDEGLADQVRSDRIRPAVAGDAQPVAQAIGEGRIG
jgi:hypothetical protein